MRVLVTGENSYAGRQFEKRMLELNSDWKIDFISVRDDEWKSKDFSGYDALYHVAAIVHEKEKSENESLYYKINRDLTYELAVKAKLEGVKSFVFLSTIAVYGLIGKIGEDTIISKETHENPVSYYGKSKLQAENLIKEIKTSVFKVSILRVPIIYGPYCPGNYKLLSKLAKKILIFPKVNNQRSMIFVDHLSDIVSHVLAKELSGMFLVKNPEDVNTLDMFNEIAKVHNRRIYKSYFLGLIVKIFGNSINIFRKMFGNLSYKDVDSRINGFEYKTISMKDSVRQSELQKEVK